MTTITVQQMSISFGVAAAGLTTAFFISDSVRSDPVATIHGIHAAFLTLGGLTILSAIVFYRLKSGDGSNVSQQTNLHLS
jgi:FtsH-binding integral membrane protein